MENTLQDRKIEAEIIKLLDDAYKARSEAEKIQKETRWYPLMLVSGISAAIGGLVTALTMLVTRVPH